MKKWLLAIVFGAVLILGACGGDNAGNGNDAANNNDNNSAVTAGEEAFANNNCASCHGGDLEGISGPDLTNVGSDHSAEDIEDIIENGQGGMPAQPQVSDEDRTEIASWLSEKK